MPRAVSRVLRAKPGRSLSPPCWPPATKPAEGVKADEKKADASKKEEAKTPAAPVAPEKPRVAENMEPYRALFTGKIPALVDARRADAIKPDDNVIATIKSMTAGRGADYVFEAAGNECGFALATDKALATIPLTCYVLGSAVTTIPASLLMGRVGRRAGFQTGSALGMVGAAIGCRAGFCARGGTEGVGRATTNAVVQSSLAVIVLDYLMTRMIFR